MPNIVIVKRSNKRRIESAYTQHHSVQPLHARYSLRSCHPGHAGAGALYRSAALPVRRAKLQLSRPMISRQRAAVMALIPLRKKNFAAATAAAAAAAAAAANFFSKRYKGYFS